MAVNSKWKANIWFRLSFLIILAMVMAEVEGEEQVLFKEKRGENSNDASNHEGRNAFENALGFVVSVIITIPFYKRPMQVTKSLNQNI